MNWIKVEDRLPEPGVYCVKIDGFINYCSFSLGRWYWMQALNGENMRYLRRYPLVGMETKVDEWLDIPDPTRDL